MLKRTKKYYKLLKNYQKSNKKLLKTPLKNTKKYKNLQQQFFFEKIQPKNHKIVSRWPDPG